MAAERQMILAVNAFASGHHEAAWRMPGVEPERVTDARFYHELARTAERGCFDLFFVADFMAYSPLVRYDVRWALEPLTLFATIAAATDKIGLAATGSTTYSRPEDLARAFATLENISRGRSAWNIVTSGDPNVAANFGRSHQVPHAQRYAHGREFVDGVMKLWKRWDLDPGPVLLQAGSSPAGRAFAAEYADIAFTATPDLQRARTFRTQLRRNARTGGRNPDKIKVMPGFFPILGSTEAEAQRTQQELDTLLLPARAIEWLADYGIDLSNHDVDEPLPTKLWSDPAFEGITSRVPILHSLARQAGPVTIAQFARSIAGSRGHARLTGTPEQIAEHMELWLSEGGADGFMIMPSHFPQGLDLFVDHVVPLLQQRGLTRSEYQELGLRENLGIV